MRLRVRAGNCDRESLAAAENVVVEPGETTQLDAIEIEKELLARHASCVRSLARAGGSPLPETAVEQVTEAAERFGLNWLELQGDVDSHIRARLPLLERFDDVLGDAWDVLDGRAGSHSRLRDALKLAGAAGPLVRRGASPLDDAALESLIRRLQRLREATPSQEPAVPKERYVPLLMAAALVSGGSAQAVDLAVSAVLDQLCGYEGFGAVSRAAGGAFRGGPAEIEFFLGAAGAFLGSSYGSGFPSVPPGGTPWPLPGGPLFMPCARAWPPDPADDAQFSLAQDPALLEKWICTAEVVLGMRELKRRFGFPPEAPEYAIESVVPEHACAGGLVTIRGHGFGARGGVVLFPLRPDGTRQRTVEASARSWTDTEITVPVPDTAGCGEIGLAIAEGTVCACGACIDINRHGTSTVRVEVGTPVIFDFTVNGATDAKVCPDAPLSLGWQVCNADSIRVRRVSTTGPNLDLTNPEDDTASLGPAPAGVDAEYELTAENSCGAERATVRFSVCSPSLLLRAAAAGLDVGVTPASDPVRVSTSPGGDLSITATGSDVCGVRRVTITVGSVQHCTSGSISGTGIFDFALQVTESDPSGPPGLSASHTHELTAGRCQAGYEPSRDTTFRAEMETSCGTLTTPPLTVHVA